ncbi:glucose PTS transporter transcription antiterminator GlcT [Thermohalobacter berrensis]|uniref:PRD domain-containing protein n=1 Tax=Thermohalobacter berrensis TaxID=99594 RepID=A0A419T9M3_9FIRM|nr:PRD domain-containing protein [Thermohalobacter berrensis]RKD34181.1 hypothetical protein BET03_07780 [Thermohalobacter berrensis]
MENYKLKKILSNNVVLAEKDSDDYILVGKGIGFGKKKGEFLDNNKSIEKAFVPLEKAKSNSYNKILNDIDKEIVAVSEEIIAMASKRLEEELNPHIHIALADHINFALKRLEEGLEIVNPFLDETRHLYEEEFSISKDAAKLINERLGVKVPEGEIGFITLHIHSARKNRDVSSTLRYTKLIKELVNTVEKELNIKIPPDSLEYSRLVSHFKFAIERITTNQRIENVLLDKLKTDFYNYYSVANKIGEIIRYTLDTDVPDDEIGYITLHLYRLKKIYK